MVFTVVYIDRAVISFKTKKTFTSIMCVMIDASGVVFARVEFFGTKGNFRLAILSHESRLAFTIVRLNLIDTRRVILAFIISTIVDIRFTSRSGESGRAFTTKKN